MGSSVAARPNLYQVLGLTPSASDGEIARAFADAMSMFRVRPPGVLAEIGVAYETLRNPAKRREYDRSIGIAPPAAGPRQWAIAAPAVRWAPLTGAPAFAPAPLAERPAPPKAEEPRAIEQVSAIAASLRAIARPDPLGPPVQRKDLKPRPDAAEPAIPHFLAEPRLDSDDEPEERAFEWKKPALAVGGFVAAAGLIGTLAGLSVRDNAQSIGGERSITAALPTPKARAAVPSVAVAAASEPQTERIETSPQLRHAASRHRAPSWVEHSVPKAEAAADAVEAPAEQTAADPLAPASADAAPQPVAASMPLPNGVVARTIERIGYSCGKVASSAAVDGSPGVFTVTCTSGQRYQASPIHGRYRFRRLGGR